MLLYLGGKMSGLPEYNYPAFHEASKRLRALGYDVLNPAETAGGITHLPRETYIVLACANVAAADAIVMMEPDCWESRGAKLEMILAWEYRKPIYVFDYKRGLGDEIEIIDWKVLGMVHARIGGCCAAS